MNVKGVNLNVIIKDEYSIVFSSHRAKFRIYERIWKIKVVFSRFALFVALS